MVFSTERLLALIKLHVEREIPPQLLTESSRKNYAECAYIQVYMACTTLSIPNQPISLDFSRPFNPPPPRILVHYASREHGVGEIQGYGCSSTQYHTVGARQADWLGGLGSPCRWDAAARLRTALRS